MFSVDHRSQLIAEVRRCEHFSP